MACCVKNSKGKKKKRERGAITRSKKGSKKKKKRAFFSTIHKKTQKQKNPNFSQRGFEAKKSSNIKTEEKESLPVGLEPTTLRLTAECTAICATGALTVKAIQLRDVIAAALVFVLRAWSRAGSVLCELCSARRDRCCGTAGTCGSRGRSAACSGVGRAWSRSACTAR